MIKRYTSPKVAEPAPDLWSNCIVCDGIAYIAGLTARNADGVTIDGLDEYEQTKIIFEKHKALIEAAGGKMSDFTKLTIFVTRIENNKQVWQARAEFFKGDFPVKLRFINFLKTNVLCQGPHCKTAESKSFWPLT